MIHRTLAGILLTALLAGCHTVPVADLAENSDLYRDTGYETKLPGDRSVFVAPIADERQAPVEASAPGTFPIVYDGDARWQRPVDAMVDDLLRREIDSSRVFARTTTEPASADVVLLPSLAVFATGGIEEVSGGRSLAEAGLHIRAYGKLDASGQRPLLLDQVYGDRQVTELAFRTVSRHVLAGLALHNALLRMLQGLDSKNIGRDGMPSAPAAIPGLPPAAAPAAAAPGR